MKIMRARSVRALLPLAALGLVTAAAGFTTFGVGYQAMAAAPGDELGQVSVRRSEEADIGGH